MVILIAFALAPVALAIFLLGLVRPRLFLYVLFALAPTQFLFIPVSDFSVSPADGLVLVCAAAMCVRLACGHRPAWASVATHRYILAFFCVCIVGFMINDTWARTVVRLPMALVPSLLAVEVLRTRRDLQRATIAVMLGGVLDVVYGAWFYVRGTPLHPTRFAGMSGGWSGSNFVAMTILTATMVLLARRGASRHPSRLFAPAVLAGFGAATLSKMAPLAFLASWFSGVKSLVSRSNKRRLGTAVLFVAFAVAVFPAARSALSARFEREQRADGSALNSVDIRMLIFQVSLSAFEDNPITGIGFARFMDYSASKFEVAMTSAFEAATHNTYLEVLVETGVLGALVFLLHFREYVRRAPAAIHRVIVDHDVTVGAALAGLPVVLVAAATNDLILIYSFWSVCGLALATLCVVSRETRSARTS